MTSGAVANSPAGVDCDLQCVPGATVVDDDCGIVGEVVPSGIVVVANRKREHHSSMVRRKEREHYIHRTGWCWAAVVGEAVPAVAFAVAVVSAVASAVAAGTTSVPGMVAVPAVVAAALDETAGEPLGVADIAVAGAGLVDAVAVASAEGSAYGSGSGGPGRQTLPCQRSQEYP